MSSKNPILPDELFRKQLSSYEEEFEAPAWEHMKTLLDGKDRKKPFLWWLFGKKKKSDNTLILIFITMAALSIISLVTYLTLGSGEATEISTAVLRPEENANPKTEVYADAITSNNTATVNSIIAEEDAAAFDKSVKPTKVTKSGAGKPKTVNSGKKTSVGNNSPSGKAVNAEVKKDESLPETNVRPPASSPAPEVKGNVLKDTLVISNGKVYKRVYHKVWVPDEYEYVELPREKYMDGFWMGIHFTTQRAEFELGKDSNGIAVPFNNNSAGFNIQFMSGNQFRRTDYWAAYGGFDFGMQFYGRSERKSVALATAKEDSGYTRIGVSSMDLLFRGHWEYSKYKIVPYVNLMAGPRLYMTTQHISAYLDLDENERSTNDNLHTSASLMYGGGIGARLKVGNHVSLDARYEMLWGTDVKIVNQLTTPNANAEYKINPQTIAPAYSQLKIGVIFDMAQTKHKEKLVRPGYYREEVYDSLMLDPKDSSIRYLPCPCGPCDKTDEQPRRTGKARGPEDSAPREPREPQQTDEERTRTNPPRTGNNTNTTTPKPKSSFPGVKTPPAPAPKPPVH